MQLAGGILLCDCFHRAFQVTSDPQVKTAPKAPRLVQWIQLFRCECSSWWVTINAQSLSSAGKARDARLARAKRNTWTPGGFGFFFVCDILETSRRRRGCVFSSFSDLYAAILLTGWWGTARASWTRWTRGECWLDDPCNSRRVRKHHNIVIMEDLLTHTHTRPQYHQHKSPTRLCLN